MKQLLLKIILITSLVSCTNAKTVFVDRVVIDTVNVKIIRDTIYKDTLVIEKTLITDECLENELRIMNIKHYIDITEKNKNNQKFFYGWIKRAVQ